MRKRTNPIKVGLEKGDANLLCPLVTYALENQVKGHKRGRYKAELAEDGGHQ
jgi:hypothetical protein